MNIQRSKIWMTAITMQVVSYWVLVVLLIVSCSSGEDSIRTSEPLPITFSLQKQGTRAADGYVAEGIIPTGREIGVFAYYQGTDNWDSNEQEPSQMYNQRMTVKDADGNLTYSPLHYWPNNKAGEVEEKLTFVAYYPYSTTHSGDHGVMIDQTDISKGHAKMEFRQYEEASKQTDLMISGWIHNQSRNSTPQPQFSFNHMLAKVKINVSGVTPTKVTLKHVGMSAYIDFLDKGTPTWEPTWVTASMKYGIATIDNFSGDSPILLMIPQSTSGIKIIVEHSGGTKEADLPTTGSGKWEAGKYYEYNITIN